MLRDDVDDGADRVRAEECALGAAHDLDSFHLVRRQRREVEAAAEGVRLDAIDHHERVVRLAAAREQRRHGAAAAVARDGEARHQAKRIGNGLRLGRLQVAARDDGDRIRRPRQGQLHLRGRHHDRLGEGADVQVERDARLLAGRRDDRERFAAEAFRRDADFVPARSDAVELELSLRGGVSGGDDRQRAREHDARARHACAGGVRHRPAHNREGRVRRERDARGI